MSIQQLINFITTQKPTYVNADFKITFLNYRGALLEIKHEGWKLPSVCKDSPPDIGYGQIVNDKKLIINLESFDCSQRIYLSIEVLTPDSIRIRHDDYHRSDMILTLF